MSDVFTTVELATLSEDDAVARQFDATNARAGRWFSLLVGAISFGLFVASATTGRGPFTVVPAATVLVAAVLFLGLRRVVLKVPAGQGRTRFLHPIALYYQRSPRPFALSWLLVGFSLVWVGAYGTEALVPLVSILGYFTLAFRLRPIERIALHLSVIGITLGAAMLGIDALVPAEESSELLPALISQQGLALVIGLLVTRRRRRSILALFRQGREGARIQLRMQQELAYAREIQLSMLPDGCPPQGWLDICSLSWPATEVGGDYYDYFPLAADGLPHGRLAVVIGDVAGHGMASGLMLAGLRSSLTILVDEIDQPLSVLAKLNRMVQQTARRRTLVTLAIAVFDRDRHAATLASAGHPPALLARAGGVEELTLPSLPLGTQLKPEFGERELALAAGDVLLLYSDGLYEGADLYGQPYGLARLKDLLARQAPAATASEVQAAIVADFNAFRGGAPLADDLTAVVIKVLAEPAPAP